MVKVGIIGGGISSLMAAYSLSKDPNVEVVVFEQGKDITERVCPILTKKVEKCINCKNCGIMQGMAGAGAFSDGKYNITTEFGGWLQDVVGPEITTQYIEKADSILVNFGATVDRFQPNNELKKLCLQNDLYMLQSQCKHLGTDANFDTMVNMIEFLERLENVEIKTNTTVTCVGDNSTNDDKKCIYYTNESKNNLSEYDIVDKVIFAVGRVGSNFFSSWCQAQGIELTNNQVDIGVRVELPAVIWEDFEKKIYEPKIHYISKKYGDSTRMFCFNGRGEVVTENTNGVLTVNGHAYKAEDKKTENTNFALLSTIRFTQPFNKPIEYARHVASMANMISGGNSIIVQRLGDLENGRRTDEHRLQKSTVRPSLKGAVAGDLSLCLPKRQLDNIIETLHALDKIAPGTANYDTLLYGIECKYYSARPKTNDKFELDGHSGYYAIGDGAGFTRSLAQAAAQGLMVADTLLEEAVDVN
jgi:uncharacterized FAD-dependent dehydrogenase